MSVGSRAASMRQPPVLSTGWRHPSQSRLRAHLQLAPAQSNDFFEYDLNSELGNSNQASPIHAAFGVGVKASKATEQLVDEFQLKCSSLQHDRLVTLATELYRILLFQQPGHPAARSPHALMQALSASPSTGGTNSSQAVSPLARTFDRMQMEEDRSATLPSAPVSRAQSNAALTALTALGAAVTSHPGFERSPSGLSTASVADRRPVRDIECAADSAEQLAQLTKIAEFEIISELGRGSFGVVHLAADESDELFAIKSCYHGATIRDSPSPLSSESAVAISGNASRSVDSEIALMKKLRHKHIVQLHAVILDPLTHQCHLVMQYIENGPIAKLRHDGTCKRLPETDALCYMAQVSAGLEYLHRHGIIHRDIKPENILIGNDRSAYVADFGVSTVIGDELSRGPSRFEGTLAFVSPELIEDATAVNKYGRESDVWAFGITLYALLFGSLPFYGWNQPSLLRAILYSEVAFPDESTSSPPAGAAPSEAQTSAAQDHPPVSSQAKELLRRLLRKDPQQRMTLREFRRDATVRTASGSSKQGVESSPNASILEGEHPPQSPGLGSLSSLGTNSTLPHAGFSASGSPDSPRSTSTAQVSTSGVGEPSSPLRRVLNASPKLRSRGTCFEDCEVPHSRGQNETAEAPSGSTRGQLVSLVPTDSSVGNDAPYSMSTSTASPPSGSVRVSEQEEREAVQWQPVSLLQRGRRSLRYASMSRLFQPRPTSGGGVAQSQPTTPRAAPPPPAFPTRLRAKIAAVAPEN